MAKISVIDHELAVNIADECGKYICTRLEAKYSALHESHRLIIQEMIYAIVRLHSYTGN